jgi:hypothetical protein
MRKFTILIVTLVLACLLPFKTANAQLIWEANTSKGTSVFAGLEKAPGIIDIVSDPKGLYGKVYHFNIWDNPAGGKARCEAKGIMVNGSELYLKKGTNYYIGWRSLWDKNVATTSNAWVALFQMHAYGHTGSGAPLVIRSLGDGKIYLQNNPNGVNQDLWSAPIVREKWQSFVLHVNLSDDPKKGYVELWYNGVQQKLYNGKTLMNCATEDKDAAAYNRLKWGIYRSGAAKGNWNGYMSGAKVGTTLASVMPTLKSESIDENVIGSDQSSPSVYISQADNNQFNVTLNELTGTTLVKVVGLNGVAVKEEKIIDQQTFNLDLNGVTPGLYVVQLINSKKTVAKKVIVQ